MSSSLTSRLKLYKADPGTGEPVDVAKLNQSLDKIDAAIGPADVTSTTRPLTPYPNQLIRESDTAGRIYIRNAANTNWDAIPVSGAVFPSSVDIERATSSSLAYTAKVLGDAQQRWIANASGVLDWGDGTAARDTNLYRASANLLQTDDAFNAAAGLRSYGNHVTGAEDGISNTAGAGSATSTAFANIPATSSFTLAKKRSDTRIRVDISLSCFSTAGATDTSLAVRVNGVDYTCIRHRHTAVEYETIVGWAYVPAGVAAGNQTIQARWASTGTTSTTAGVSWLALSAREVS